MLRHQQRCRSGVPSAKGAFRQPARRIESEPGRKRRDHAPLAVSELVSPRASLTRKRFLARMPCAFLRPGQPQLHRALRRGISVRRVLSADLIGKLCVVARPDDRQGMIKKLGRAEARSTDSGARAGNQRRFDRLGCRRQQHGAAMNWRIALVILAALAAAVSVFVTWPWSDAAWWGITIIACIAWAGLIYDDDQRQSASRDAEILREIQHLHKLIDDILPEARGRRNRRRG
jgi:hypothetical protein